eukprot:GFUD01111253.1.p1 GENE.GFUD01111253.1~~GFUD01111253.1.p1  ORF type:complete len:144 (+),score=16.69 GFUD01111253.1:251-682(+)
MKLSIFFIGFCFVLSFCPAKGKGVVVKKFKGSASRNIKSIEAKLDILLVNKTRNFEAEQSILKSAVAKSEQIYSILQTRQDDCSWLKGGICLGYLTGEVVVCVAAGYTDGALLGECLELAIDFGDYCYGCICWIIDHLDKGIC